MYGTDIGNRADKNLENVQNFIDQYDGTAIGQSVKNMLDNGTDLESICDYADIEYSSED